MMTKLSQSISATTVLAVIVLLAWLTLPINAVAQQGSNTTTQTAPAGDDPLVPGMDAYDRGDYATALKRWFAVARLGNPEAQLLVGTMFKEGIGTDKDESQAVTWFRRAADNGSTEAQYNLGIMYAKGLGVARNPTEAAKWYLKAASHGHAEAQNNVGVMLANGIGVQQDRKMAVEWYERAAAQGHPTALFNLGYMYMKGYGVEPDDIFALRYFRLAANAGNPSAQKLLGDAYDKGWFGLPINPDKAAMWHARAAEHASAKP